jgi:hypothetical protein
LLLIAAKNTCWRRQAMGEVFPIAFFHGNRMIAIVFDFTIE